MSNPAASVMRIFRFGLRFSLSKTTRTCSSLQTKAFYHNNISSRPSFGVPYILAKSLVYRSPVRAMSALSPNDPSSYSRPELAVVKHMGLKLNVDFDKKVLSGEALLKFEALQSVDEVVLDVSSQTIQGVQLENGTALKYKVDGHIPNFGSRLTINLPHTVSPAEKRLSQSRSAGICTKLIDTGEDFLYKIADTQTSRCEMNKTVVVKIAEENDCCGICECESDHIVDKEATRKSRRDSFESEQSRTSYTDSDSKRRASDSRANYNQVSSPISADSEERPDSRRNSADSKRTSKTRKYSADTYLVTSTKDSESERKSSISRDSSPETVRRSSLKKDGRFAIRVQYTTDPSASALQWLEPSQTSGKKHPYLFSQCQPIHARSIMPCQDTPSVKFTYDAEVTAPEPFSILMSALTKDRQSGKATFYQPVPIPSYLLAIAVAVLEHRSIGPRTTVWSEKEEIERSAWEFAETENYLKAAERMAGPYVWTQYDLLVLPPSFPYGGMENPCLTFVTPTLLAGDRSQADVIVHEIMHSWTGNLVTNKNFEHFWLNEGFTVFLERKVAASLIADAAEAKKSRDFHSLLGLQELQEAVTEQFRPTDPLTNLVPSLSGVHPDDAFSRVPYEKGSLFLRYLEDLVGGPEVFDEFLRSYLQNFARRSLDTDEFKAYLLGYFTGRPAHDKLASVDWDKWLYTPGMPPIIPDYDTSMTKAVSNLLAKITPTYEFSGSDVAGFTPHQVINLLQELVNRAPLPAARLEALGASYGVADSHNSEIRYRWLRLCCKSEVRARLPEVLEFVNSCGRMKYVRPLYRDMYAWEEVRAQAVSNFLQHEREMMHVAAYTVRKDLHLADTVAEKQ